MVEVPFGVTSNHHKDKRIMGKRQATDGLERHSRTFARFGLERGVLPVCGGRLAGAVDAYGPCIRRKNPAESFAVGRIRDRVRRVRDGEALPSFSGSHCGAGSRGKRCGKDVRSITKPGEPAGCSATTTCFTGVAGDDRGHHRV